MPPTSACRLACVTVLRILALSLVCAVFTLLHHFARPVTRLFFCDNQSIRYPMLPSTVPYYIAAPVGLFLPLIAIGLVEFRRSSSRCRSPSALSLLTSPLVKSIARAVYYFFLGCAGNELLTITAKLVLGVPRPFFYTVCRPTLVCNATVPWDPAVVCQISTSSRKLADAMMSFPSGHASFSMYVATFVVGYLRARFYGFRVLRFCLQLTLLYVGLYVGYSRVADYMHHWYDVVAGNLLGAGVAWATLSAAGLSRPSPPQAAVLAVDDATAGITHYPRQNGNGHIPLQSTTATNPEDPESVTIGESG